MATVAIAVGFLSIVFGLSLLAVIVRSILRNRVQRLREREYFKRLDGN